MSVQDNNPIFSVIMASYNAEKYIACAIESVLKQSISRWELIIADDCSTDSSYEIALEYSLVDSRISVYRLEYNSGAASARNYAASKSKGSWLAILDADDIYLPEKLEAQLSVISTFDGDDLVLVGCGAYFFSNTDRMARVCIYSEGSVQLKNELKRSGRFPPHSSILYKSDVFQKIGGFNSCFKRAEDYDLFLRFVEHGEFACVSVPLIRYRLHSSGISVNATEQGYSQRVYGAVANLCDFLRKNHSFDPGKSQDLLDKLVYLVSQLYKGSVHQRLDSFSLDFSIVKTTSSTFKISLFILRHPLLSFGLILRKFGLLSFEKKVINEYVRHVDVWNSR